MLGVSDGLMKDGLRSSNYLPTTSPYTDALTCNSAVFNLGGTSGNGAVDDDIVDWVWIELRDATDTSLVVGSQSALLQRDGDVVEVDGISSLDFSVSPGNYVVTINHRNHLGVMTTNAISLSDVTTIIDFTNATNQITFGTNAQTTFGMPTDIVSMWAGDTSGNGQVRFLGPGNDLNNLKNDILSDTANTTGSLSYPVSGYSDADINLNGQARFLGPGNDNNILKSIILANPANTSGSISFPLTEQVPN